MSHTLPELPYSNDALEPTIDAKTMEIHHGKHHQAYITNLNNAIAGKADLEAKSIGDLISDLSSVPEDIRGVVRNNGGGHFNHSLFWTVLGANGGAPSGVLAAAIDKTFGGLEALKALVEKAGATRFGSGWAWLVVKADKTLAVTSTPNQDSPIMKGVADVVGAPILGIDVWEHAYYLNYQNRRPDYLKAIWSVINWKEVGRRYDAAVA